MINCYGPERYWTNMIKFQCPVLSDLVSHIFLGVTVMCTDRRTLWLQVGGKSDAEYLSDSGAFPALVMWQNRVSVSGINPSYIQYRILTTSFYLSVPLLTILTMSQYRFSDNQAFLSNLRWRDTDLLHISHINDVLTYQRSAKIWMS